MLRRWRFGILAAALGLAGLVAACGPFPQNAFNPHSEYANEGLDLFWLTIWLGLAVGGIVEIALIWVAIRYRRRRLTEGLPPQIHGSTVVEFVWTALPVLIVGAILIPTLQTIFKTQAPAPANAMPINVIGHQFWWEFQYPDANPEVVTANELHLPVGRTVNLILHSDDVIHSFWIPALGGKRDAFPSHINYLWMTPDSTGTFPGQCYQLCGYSHGNMRERAIIEQPTDFQSWLTAQQQPAAAPPPDSDAAQGAQVFQQRGCAGCHTIQGTPAAG